MRATLPDADQVALLSVPGVSVGRGARRHRAASDGDSDAVARFLLTQTSARDLEITAHSLEDAFIALTGRQRPLRET